MAPRGKKKSKAKQAHRKTTASASNPTDDGRVFRPEIISDILSRLPVKTLLRFSCVSNQWRTCISNPRFISQHLSRQPASIIIHAHRARFRIEEEVLAEAIADAQAKGVDGPDLRPDGHIIYKYGPGNTRTRRFSTIDHIIDFPGSDARDFDPMQLVGSVNGIICIAHNYLQFVLWNPATRTSLILPRPKLEFRPFFHHTVSIGFGFDPARNDYKIIRILCNLKRNLSAPVEVEILSVNRGSWRPLSPNGLGPWMINEIKCSAVVKGAPYWVAFDHDAVLENREMLVTFDPQHDVFYTVRYAWATGGKLRSLFGEIRGCLGAAVWEGRGTVVDVWIMDEGNVWSRMYKVYPFRIGTTVGLYGDNGIVSEEGYEGNVSMFNLESMKTEDFFSVENALPTTIHVVNYTESLSRMPRLGTVVI